MLCRDEWSGWGQCETQESHVSLFSKQTFGTDMWRLLRVCYINPGAAVEIVYHRARWKTQRSGTKFCPSVHQHEFRSSPGQSMNFYQIYSSVREKNFGQGLSVHCGDRMQSSAAFCKD